MIGDKLTGVANHNFCARHIAGNFRERVFKLRQKLGAIPRTKVNEMRYVMHNYQREGD